MSALPVGRKRRSPLEVLAQWWLAWTGFAPAYSEFSGSAQDEVGRIAKDVGVPPAELKTVARLGSDATVLLLRRMKSLELDPKKVSRMEPGTFQDLRRVCTLCESQRRCSRDFASDSADQVWEDYCPNVATLKALSALPWAARHVW
jgi:hypothetical protein